MLGRAAACDEEAAPPGCNAVTRAESAWSNSPLLPVEQGRQVATCTQHVEQHQQRLPDNEDTSSLPMPLATNEDHNFGHLKIKQNAVDPMYSF